MSESYQPPSDFLRAVASDEVPLFGSAFAEENFQRLLAMMTDQDRANRDWATLLVAQQELDTDEVRNALICAAQDQDEAVRAEAILGLAQRDPGVALPFLRSALRGQTVMPPVLEAAVLVADRSLVDDLRQFSEPSDDAFADQLALEALAACEQGPSP